MDVLFLPVHIFTLESVIREKKHHSRQERHQCSPFLVLRNLPWVLRKKGIYFQISWHFSPKIYQVKFLLFPPLDQISGKTNMSLMLNTTKYVLLKLPFVPANVGI